MSKNTLFSMMRLLGKAELDEFAIFLVCPLHCPKAEFRTCFQALRSVHPSMDERRLTDAVLFAKVYPTDKFDDLKLRRLKSEMCRLLEDYLVLKELKKAPRLRSELLVGALSRKDDYPLFKETIQKRLRKLESGDEKGKACHAESAFLYQALYHHPETEGLDMGSDTLQLLVQHQEQYFAIAYLENAAESLVKQNVIDARERLFFNEAISLFAQSQLDKSPVLQAFHALHRLYSEQEGADSFEQSKSLVLANLGQMDAKEKRMALKLLTSKAISLSPSSPEQDQWVFDLYRTSVEQGLSVAENGAIDPNHFLNIVISGAKVGAFDWVLGFFKQHKSHLPDTEKEIVECLSLGSVYYQRGLKKGGLVDFISAKQYIEMAPQRCHEKYNLRIRSLSVRIHYELFRWDGDPEQVERQLKNFESYLDNNRALAGTKKSGYRNFLKALRALLKLATNPESTKAMVGHYLEHDLAKANMLLHEWLRQKAEELKSSLRR